MSAGPVKEDEHFIVWMRTAALPNFRKLWGRIETDIPAGAAIRISIRNRYNSYRFGGKKKVCQYV
jgi:LEM3 (ligand-effect modulator 3) family / CDC50 family